MYCYLGSYYKLAMSQYVHVRTIYRRTIINCECQIASLFLVRNYYIRKVCYLYIRTCANLTRRNARKNAGTQLFCYAINISPTVILVCVFSLHMWPAPPVIKLFVSRR